MHTGRNPSRRAVARGVAWTAPVVMIGAAAPVLAASGPQIQRVFAVGRTASGCTAGSERLTVSQDNSSSYYYRIVNVTSSTTVTDVYASMLVEGISNVTWTRRYTSTWGPVTLDPTPIVVDGRTYYRYYSQLLTIPAPVNGVITIPALSWQSSCSTAVYNRYPLYMNGRGTATIDGVQRINIGVFRSV